MCGGLFLVSTHKLFLVWTAGLVPLPYGELRERRLAAGAANHGASSSEARMSAAALSPVDVVHAKGGGEPAAASLYRMPLVMMTRIWGAIDAARQESSRASGSAPRASL